MQACGHVIPLWVVVLLGSASLGFCLLALFACLRERTRGEEHEVKNMNEL